MPFRYRDPTTLREMSDEQLVDSLKALSGGILQELQSRGYKITLTVLESNGASDQSDASLLVQLRQPTV